MGRREKTVDDQVLVVNAKPSKFAARSSGFSNRCDFWPRYKNKRRQFFVTE